MPVARQTPMYTVWEDLNQAETDDAGAEQWGAHDVESAARCHAERWDREADSDSSWPRNFMVIDPAGKRWRVSVDRVIEYSYRPAKKVRT